MLSKTMFSKTMLPQLCRRFRRKTV